MLIARGSGFHTTAQFGDAHHADRPGTWVVPGVMWCVMRIRPVHSFGMSHAADNGRRYECGVSFARL